MIEERWQDKYMEYIAYDEIGDPEEELDMMENLIYDTGKVGEAAVKLLEQMTRDDMAIEVDGMMLLLLEFRKMMDVERNE